MKTKRGGRELNPTDAARKQARKREIKRNRAERTYIRDAFGKAQNTSKLGELKAELEELIKIEQTGELNKLQKLRKRVVLEAYEVAVRKKKEEEIRQKQAEEEGKQLPHGGLSSVPLPKPPPLPAGPKPGLPPPPMPPPLPTGPGPAAAAAGSSQAGILQPPPGPPPAAAAAAAAGSSSLPVLSPPPGPPPAAGGILPPPPGPPPGYLHPPGMLPPPPGPPPVAGMLPAPGMPPPAGILPPPLLPPPGSSILPPPLAPPPAAAAISKAAATVSKPASGVAATTITGASTVAKRPLAHKDKALTSMVPASVVVRREAAAKSAKLGIEEEELSIGPGFGLAPMQKVAGGRGQRQQLQPPQMGRWGNAVTVTTIAAGSKPAAKTAGAGAGAAAAGAGGAAKGDDTMADFMNSLKDLGAFD